MELTLNGWREKKNLGHDFICKFVPETAFKNLSKVFPLGFIQNCQYLFKQCKYGDINIFFYYYYCYSNAGSKTIKFSFRRGAEVLLLSGRLDWIQTKVKHWKIWKFI